MAYPDLEQPFVVHTDASSEELGVLLYQDHGGKVKVFGHGSRTLTQLLQLKFVALKWAISDKCRDYLFYAPSLVVFNDNNPLTYVMSSAKLNATGHWWVAELADCNFTIKCQPGTFNVDLDILSRIALDMHQHATECTEKVPKMSLTQPWKHFR